MYYILILIGNGIDDSGDVGGHVGDNDRGSEGDFVNDNDHVGDGDAIDDADGNSRVDSGNIVMVMLVIIVIKMMLIFLETCENTKGKVAKCKHKYCCTHNLKHCIYFVNIMLHY